MTRSKLEQRATRRLDPPDGRFIAVRRAGRPSGRLGVALRLTDTRAGTVRRRGLGPAGVRAGGPSVRAGGRAGALGLVALAGRGGLLSRGAALLWGLLSHGNRKLIRSKLNRSTKFGVDSLRKIDECK